MFVNAWFVNVQKIGKRTIVIWEFGGWRGGIGGLAEVGMESGGESCSKVCK